MRNELSKTSQSQALPAPRRRVARVPKDSVVLIANTTTGNRRIVIPPSKLCASLRANLDRLDAEFYEEE